MMAKIKRQPIAVTPYIHRCTFPVNGNYTYLEAKKDYPLLYYWDTYKSEVVNNKLEVTLPANKFGVKDSFGKQCSTMAIIDTPDMKGCNIVQTVMFAPGFDFGKGLKFGFGSLWGAGYTGGISGKDGLGGSGRFMTEGAAIIPYFYHVDQPGQYGHNLGVDKYPVIAGVPYKIDTKILCSTGTYTNGNVTVYINDKLWFSRQIRTSLNNSIINKICFENFRGGNDYTWISLTDGKIIFDNILIQQI